MFSTREIFDAVPSVQASMMKNALDDMMGCLHYSDDWDVLDTYNDSKVEADVSTADH